MQKNSSKQKQAPLKKNIKRNERRKARQAAIRQWIREYKDSLQCEECGENRAITLEFHRKDFHPVEHSIKRVFDRGKSLRSVKRYIKKNQVLCANCHKVIHNEVRNPASL